MFFISRHPFPRSYIYTIDQMPRSHRGVEEEGLDGALNPRPTAGSSGIKLPKNLEKIVNAPEGYLVKRKSRIVPLCDVPNFVGNQTHGPTRLYTRSGFLDRTMERALKAWHLPFQYQSLSGHKFPLMTCPSCPMLGNSGCRSTLGCCCAKVRYVRFG